MLFALCWDRIIEFAKMCPKTETGLWREDQFVFFELVWEHSVANLFTPMILVLPFFISMLCFTLCHVCLFSLQCRPFTVWHIVYIVPYLHIATAWDCNPCHLCLGRHCYIKYRCTFCTSQEPEASLASVGLCYFP